MMRQTWGKLLLAHWPASPDPLRAKLPAGLELDLYEGRPWVTLTAFAHWDVRLSFTPLMPLASSYLETNLRTYVRAGQSRGVWFLSLDTNSSVIVMGGQALFRLTFSYAEQELRHDGDVYTFESRRAARPIAVKARWERGEPLPPTTAGSLEHFLVERKCTFTEADGRLKRARVENAPWPLRSARVLELEHSLEPAATPVLAHHVDELEVEVYALEDHPKVALE